MKTGQKVTVNNISMGGICIDIKKHLAIDSRHCIELTSTTNRKIEPECLVIWSSFIGTIKENGEVMPVYSVGLKFIELKDSEKYFLKILTSAGEDQH